LANTYIIDDREDTFKYNRDNGILVPPFVFSDCEDLGRDEMLKKVRVRMNEDRVLKDLICFFEEHKDVEDIRSLNLKEKFGSEEDDEASSFNRIVNKYRFSPSHNIKQQ
jgi:hypothetical protein